MSVAPGVQSMHGMHAAQWEGSNGTAKGGARQFTPLSGIREDSVSSPLTNEGPVLRGAQHPFSPYLYRISSDMMLTCCCR